MKLKRLVCAIVAVGMMVAMLPVSAVTAFAASPITGIVLDADGYVDVTKSTCTYDESSQRYNGDGWYLDNTNQLCLSSNRVFNADSSSPKGVAIKNNVSNNSVIEYGIFDSKTFYNGSTIKDGVFASISNRRYNGNVNTGNVEGGLIEYYDAGGGAVLKNAIVWGEVRDYGQEGTIVSGIIPAKSKYIDSTSKYYEIEAPGCIVKSSYQSKEFSIKEGMCVIDETEPPAMTVTVTPIDTSRKLSHWIVEGISIDSNDLKGSSITFTVPAGNTENIKVTAEMEKIDLSVSNNLPADGKNPDGTYGSKYDGWTYDETTNTKNELVKSLTVYPDYTADIDNEEVDWSVTNNGTISNGKYTYKVYNYGNITGGTYAGNFYNRNTTDNPNANAVREEGIVTSGVFSRSADFGTQNPDITWLNVNNGTINGIDGFSMAGVVGKQTVTVTTTDTNFTGWVVSGDSDLTLTEEQRTSKTLTLELDGSKKNTIVLTAMTPEGYQHFTVIDGKATNAEGQEITSARADDPVTLIANDAPDGMVFDRWEVTPTAAEAELKGFDASAATTTFKMGTQEITIRAMYRMADVEEPNVLGTVAIVATAGVGAAVLGWTGYNIAADLYAQSILPEGTAIPETKEALAVMLWQNAGKPEVMAADGTVLSETEQAQQWVVTNGLMENEEDGSFHPEKSVGKFAALNAIKEQNEASVNK